MTLLCTLQQRRSLLQGSATTAHYSIGARGTTVDLDNFLFDHAEDPALKVSILCSSQYNISPSIKNYRLELRKFLLAEIAEIEYDESTTFSRSGLDSIRIKNDRIYSHKTLRVNFTTYDIQRDSDFTRPDRDGADIMVLSEESSQKIRDRSPFWYARVVGIYHADVLQINSCMTKRIDFLHVRWLGQVKGDKHGDKHMRSEQLTFIPDNSIIQSFGFISPRDVIRRAHLIPAFELGRTEDLLGPSPVVRVNPNDCATDDYDGFYVNRLA